MITNKIIYWIATAVCCGIMLFSAQMYFLKYEMVKGFFQSLNYPTYIVYPIAIAKVLGMVAILSNKSKWLKEWAYAGFFFDTALALVAHYQANQGISPMPIAVMATVIISRIFWKKIY